MNNKTLENIKCINNKSKNYYLMGDKAYKNKEKFYNMCLKFKQEKTIGEII